MCGIIGYTGNKEALPILVEGLRALEYRGYDSAGVYLPGCLVLKSVGPIDNLVAKITDPILGVSGIAHTRWATHGEPTEENAHPHLDQSGKIALVHNGIIENFRELREDLIDRGIDFKSTTDSEVLAKLIGSFYEGDLLKAVQEALRLVRGTYGIVVISESNPETLITARLGSPIVIGLSAEGNIVASDTSAILSHTKDVVYLEDGEIAVVKKDSYEVTTLQGAKLTKFSETLEMDIESVQKQGFEHFMLKEIFEIPEVIENTIRGRIILKEGKVKLGGLDSVLSDLVEFNRLTIIGCGSAYYAGQLGRYLLEEYASLPTEVELGSEYRYKRNLSDKNSGVIFVTQSGETADTLASLRSAKEQGLISLGIVNAVGSTIARETDVGVYNHAGPEIAVASTKGFISQITVFVLLTILIAREKEMTKEEGKEILSELKELPGIINEYLKDLDKIKTVAKKYAGYRDAMFIGRKFHAPIAYEGSLKLKEVSYIHAEAYAAGELKHGSIAMLDENFPVIAIAPQDDVYGKMISNIEEVKARKAPVLVIATEGDKYISEIADDVLFIPKLHPMLQPILSTIPMQLLAYYIGVEKGINVDRPRNLAKSVTVE
jgi:glucosamine--fructose-6-phosphate aminotransferase (isomerizing)